MDKSPTEALCLQVIENAIQQHPRSLQKLIGPSEIGIDCDRRLLYKLAQVPEPPRPPAWKPTVGTAVHALLESYFDNANPSDSDFTNADWITEWEVTVGQLGATPITGHADLFHRPTGTVIDFKIIGPRQLTKYRLHGPSNQYRTQAHLYAKGFTESGGWEPARQVAIWFLPRDGELRQAHWWTEPYNPHIAAEALVRINTLYAVLNLQGLDDAIASKPLCDDEWCPWCRQHQPKPERTNIFGPGTGPVRTHTDQTSLALPGLGIPQTPTPERLNLFQ